MVDRDYVKKCPECGGINLFFNKEKGEVICKDCGLVVEEKMVDFGQEWREFDSAQSEQRRRTGAPITYTQYDQGLGTEVGRKADLYNLGAKTKNKFFRLRKWQYRISTAIERNLKLALAELKRVSSYLKLPKSVEEEAARIYRMAVTKGLVRGRSMESVVVGAVYIAARLFNLPRSLNEVCNITNTNKRDVGKTYRFIARELRIRMLPSGPIDYIPKFANKLKFSAETQTKAIDILNIAQNSELTSGRGPTGLAAAALYVASLMTGEKRTQREIADVVGVTEVTIRNRYKEMIEKLNLDSMIEAAKKSREVVEEETEE